MYKQLFEPSRQLTFDTVESDRARLLSALQRTGASSLLLDLSQVEHCDSAGIAFIFEARRLCRYYNKPFEIEGIPKTIYAMAEFCGVEAMFGSSEIDCVSIE